MPACPCQKHRALATQFGMLLHMSLLPYTNARCMSSSTVYLPPMSLPLARDWGSHSCLRACNVLYCNAFKLGEPMQHTHDNRAQLDTPLAYSITVYNR
jgi:hypothetical protein